MPKIVNHAEHRSDLAFRAAACFSEHGYGGISMRKISDHLGISKSALYHYFPTKEALFLACTEQIMSREGPDIAAEGGSDADKMQHLIAAMRIDFGSEMALIFDYLRGKSQDDIAQDKAMQIALASHRRAVVGIVGDETADETLALLLGKLMLEYLSGGACVVRIPTPQN